MFWISSVWLYSNLVCCIYIDIAFTFIVRIVLQSLFKWKKKYPPTHPPQWFQIILHVVKYQPLALLVMIYTVYSPEELSVYFKKTMTSQNKRIESPVNRFQNTRTRQKVSGILCWRQLWLSSLKYLWKSPKKLEFEFDLAQIHQALVSHLALKISTNLCQRISTWVNLM